MLTSSRNRRENLNVGSDKNHLFLTVSLRGEQHHRLGYLLLNDLESVALVVMEALIFAVITLSRKLHMVVLNISQSSPAKLQPMETNMAVAQTGSRVAVLFNRVDAVEYKLCMHMNRGCRVTMVRKFFAIISRLGDGIFWYTLMGLFALLQGLPGMYLSLRMAVAGVTGLVLYKVLKSRLVRERPYINFASLTAGTQPLDRYSFPSGHTLHAVGFTVLICSSYPQLGWLCIPFAALVATSRVVLGLHYPSDVLAGASIGATVAFVTMRLLPI